MTSVLESLPPGGEAVLAKRQRTAGTVVTAEYRCGISRFEEGVPPVLLSLRASAFIRQHVRL